MIIVKLQGGLGNQMFQYAAGRQLSILHNAPLLLDLTFLKTQDPRITRRDFELDVFNIHAGIAAEKELKGFLHKSRFRRILEQRLAFPVKYQVINEKGFRFQPDFFNYPDNIYLNGYWQSEKYFLPASDKILQELTLKNPLNETNKLLESRIASCNAVSVHIRRGDYVSNAHNLSYHGVCPLSYYYEAISLLYSKETGLRLFVFTDDPAWAKQEFKPGMDFEIVSANKGKDSYYDMYLMSRCRHNIIANSSFSWWGAYLNRNPNKKVFAPRQWFASAEHDTADLVPDSWMKL